MAKGEDMKALLGIKRGMTQIWEEDGTRVPVTVVEMPPNTVTAVRTVENDGYEALQLGAGEIRAKLVAKAQLGQFGKAGVDPRRHLREVRGEVGEHKVGDVLSVADCFEPGALVDVTGTSKGRGFAGAIKRHGFSRGPMSHGSQFHRRPGSIGMMRFPHRVPRGKKMPGRYGNDRITVRGLRVVAADADASRLLIRGPVPGCIGGLLVVRTSNIKRKS